MPRNYQHTKNNNYWMPNALYRQMIYIFRDYERTKSEAEEILLASSGGYSGIKSAPGDPTANKALKYGEMIRIIDAVNNALQQLPQEYRLGVFNNITYGSPFPAIAHRNTWSTWRSRALFYTAKNLHRL
jgi:hypothetical protein